MTVPQALPTDEEVVAKVRQIVADHRDERGALLPILHAVQHTFGAVTPDVVQIIGDELNLSRADVHGVASFYRDFRTSPAGATNVRICRAEACQAVGGRELASAAQEQLGLKIGETAADGSVTLDEVFCLGNCALGPAVQVDGALFGKVTPDQLATIVAEASQL
jgi:formate dehydrogenase subunit gamma